MKTPLRGIIPGLIVLVLFGILYFGFRPVEGGPVDAGEDPPGPGQEQEDGGVRPSPGPGQEPPAPPSPPPSTPMPAGVIAELAWGSGPSQLGRRRPQEGNPEGPMSLSVDARGRILVLDQVNGRLVRLDAKGGVLGTFPLTQQAPQDVTTARDGTLLVLDRLRGSNVVLLDPETGAPRGELPVAGKGIPAAGLVTGTFVDGDAVYVEREHDTLVRIGDTSGHVDTKRPEVPGRPTRDGSAYLRAGIVDRRSGRVFLERFDRQTGQLRDRREYSLDFPVMTLLLLDTDLSGTIYLGVMGELPAGKAEPAAELGVRVFCIEPQAGTLLGQTDLPVNRMPEETFRDFAVPDEGGVVYKYLTPDGVTLMRAWCR